MKPNKFRETKTEQYEREKKKIQALGLPPRLYEAAIIKLAKKLGV